jgi:hypothetical protein
VTNSFNCNISCHKRIKEVISIQEAFQFNNERHNTYNLRNRDTDLAPPMPKKEFGKRCYSYNGALHWNNLPHEAKIAESLSSFKSILKQRMS